MARDLGTMSVLVAGATGGIGRHLVGRLAERGAHLTLLARERTRLEALGVPGAELSEGDLTDPDTPARVVSAAVAAHGRLDGVINAAGAVAFGPLVELPDAALDALVAVNLVGPLRLMRAAIPHLGEGGFLLNLSAVVAEQPVAGMIAYSATKGGLTAADVGLARELRRQKIAVIDVRPPHTETGLVERALAGQAPRLPAGLDPASVADRVIAALEGDEREVPSSAFQG